MALGDKRRRLGPTLKVELGEDAADAILDRLVGQEDVAGDLLVGPSLSDQQENLSLLAVWPQSFIVSMKPELEPGQIARATAWATNVAQVVEKSAG